MVAQSRFRSGLSYYRKFDFALGDMLMLTTDNPEFHPPYLKLLYLKSTITAIRVPICNATTTTTAITL